MRSFERMDFLQKGPSVVGFWEFVFRIIISFINTTQQLQHHHHHLSYLLFPISFPYHFRYKPSTHLLTFAHLSVFDYSLFSTSFHRILDQSSRLFPANHQNALQHRLRCRHRRRLRRHRRPRQRWRRQRPSPACLCLPGRADPVNRASRPDHYGLAASSDDSDHRSPDPHDHRLGGQQLRPGQLRRQLRFGFWQLLRPSLWHLDRLGLW